MDNKTKIALAGIVHEIEGLATYLLSCALGHEGSLNPAAYRQLGLVSGLIVGHRHPSPDEDSVAREINEQFDLYEMASRMVFLAATAQVSTARELRLIAENIVLLIDPEEI